MTTPQPEHNPFAKAIVCVTVSVLWNRILPRPAGVSKTAGVAPLGVSEMTNTGRRAELVPERNERGH